MSKETCWFRDKREGGRIQCRPVRLGRRLRGETYRSIHPVLDRILPETLGIMVYQEDVMKTVMEMAGFDVNEADTLRKILSKKDRERTLPDYRRKFCAQACERGYETGVIEKAWKMILSFAGYSFCKPHSASFALVSFKSARLRAHHPAEFMAAVISNQGGFYCTWAYVSEARRMGLEVLGPDINASEIQWTARDKNIRCGLMQIKGVHAACLQTIVRERTSGPYRSLADFLARARIHSADVEQLVKAGCFDSIERNRPQLLWEQALRRSSEGMLFAQEHRIPRVENWTRGEILQEELATLGFLLSTHPLALYGRELSGIRFLWGKELARHVGEKVTTLRRVLASAWIGTGLYTGIVAALWIGGIVRILVF